MEGKGIQENFENSPERLRISVSNLVRTLRVKETGEILYPSILNPTSLRKGEIKYQALGGGATVTQEGMGKLKAIGAIFSPEGTPDFDDARFTIPADRFNEAFDYFAKQDEKIFEDSAIREIKEELSGDEIPEVGSILTPEEVELIEVNYLVPVCQIPQDQNNKPTETGEKQISSRRLFHLFEMVAPQAVLEKMKKSRAIRFISEAEFKGDDGKTQLITPDGVKIADNLFAPNK